MAVREYEAWLVGGASEEALAEVGIDEPESLKDAKGAARRLWGHYQPTVHQAERSRTLDIELARSRCPSLDKLVRELARVCPTQ